MRSLFVILLILSVLAILFSVREVRTVYERVQNQVEVERSRRLSEEQSQTLADASDYLTQEVWRFIANKNAEYLRNYWHEVTILKRREKVLEQLAALHLTAEESALVNAAKKASDDLVAREAWAMRLVAESIGMKKADMPPEMAAARRNSREAQLSADQKAVLAMSFIFGPIYMQNKQIIRDNLQEFRQKLQNRKNAELARAATATEHALFSAQASNAVVLALLAVLLLCFYALTLRPFNRYLTSLRKIEKGAPALLTPEGSREMRGFALVFNKIYNEWQAQNRRLTELNAMDYLTGLPNRRSLEEYLEKAIARGSGNLGVVMADIDAFKSFNDAYGHMAGDQVLAGIARCLQDAVPKDKGLVSRLSGEEFVIVLPDADAESINQVAKTILRNIQKQNLRHDIVPLTDTHVTLSMGSILWERKEPHTPRELIYQADLALSQAKKNGRDQHVLFSEKDYTFRLLQNSRSHDLEVESAMHEALNQREFVPYFQPKVDLKSGRVLSAEALVRWLHPQKGLLFPDYFIPVFERNGFIKRIDLYMFEEVCKILRNRLDSGKPVVPVACNFSRLHFIDENFAERLKSIADRHAIPHAFLEIEITESALMDDPDAIIQQNRKLRESGFTVAIDDFGVGYSSLGLLQDLPADVLKIDRCFVQRDLTERKSIMIIRGIVQIAKTFGLKIVCEGVETKEQQAILSETGCDLGQGYYYSRPVELAKLESLLDGQGFPATPAGG